MDWLSKVGIELHHVVERLTARPPSAKEAVELGIAPGVAVIAIQRTSIDTRGEVVETADLVMSGDRVAAVLHPLRTRGPALLNQHLLQGPYREQPLGTALLRIAAHFRVQQAALREPENAELSRKR
ncbi:UTRA domain-containing protein [Streptomyces sp. NRRL F-5755]|uniref:UTRA domain-containing protein n=1 Tax=Streptomyces sp. NRRL F-5755 TaxID=1519475 RepID=UPI001331C270